MVASNLVSDAESFSSLCHFGQTRRYTGEDYFRHPQRVAEEAMRLGLSDEYVAAAYLHDVIEDCQVSAFAISAAFGKKVAEIVWALSDLQLPDSGNRAFRKRRYLERVRDTNDEGIHTLKILDLLDNAESIRDFDPKFWKVYRDEAMAFCDELRLADSGSVAALREMIGGGA